MQRRNESHQPPYDSHKPFHGLFHLLSTCISSSPRSPWSHPGRTLILPGGFLRTALEQGPVWGRQREDNGKTLAAAAGTRGSGGGRRRDPPRCAPAPRQHPAAGRGAPRCGSLPRAVRAGPKAGTPWARAVPGARVRSALSGTAARAGRRDSHGRPPSLLPGVDGRCGASPRAEPLGTDPLTASSPRALCRPAGVTLHPDTKGRPSHGSDCEGKKGVYYVKEKERDLNAPRGCDQGVVLCFCRRKSYFGTP